MTNNVKVAVSAPGAKQASSEIDQLRDKFTKLKQEGAKGFAIGAGAALTANALNLVEGAAQGVGEAIGSVIRAGIDGEASERKLATSLKANVAGWDGNTEAIERRIHAGLALGFTDDEQRDSMAKLVAATHDVNKAFDIQHVAMDLARFKGISLGDATDALTKVEAGSYRILKSLGIELKNNATQTDALAAVEKVAAGQAADFANTTEGKLTVAQVRFGDAMETLGTKALPLVAAAADDVSFALDRTLVPLDKVQQAAAHGVQPAIAELDQLTKAAEANGVTVEALYAAWSGSGRSIGDVAKEIGTKFSDMGQHAGKMADDVNAAGHSVSTTFSSMESHAGKLADDIHNNSRDIVDDFGTIGYAALGARDDMLQSATDEVHGYFELIRAQDDLTAANSQIAASKRVLASSSATKKEKADAHSMLVQAESDRAEALATIAAAGAGTSKTFTKTMKTLQKELAKAHGDEKKAIEAEIIRLQLLDAEAAIAEGRMLTLQQTITATLAKGGYVQNIGATPGKQPTTTKPSTTTTGGVQKNAKGGWVGLSGPELSWVGEEGPEYIVPNDKLRDTAQMASGGLTINGGVHFHDVGSDVTPEAGNRMARAFMLQVASGFRQEGARNGLHPSRP